MEKFFINFNFVVFLIKKRKEGEKWLFDCGNIFIISSTFCFECIQVARSSSTNEDPAIHFSLSVIPVD